MSSSSSSEVEGTSPRPPSMTRGPRASRRPPPPSPSSSRAPSRDEIEPREGTPLSSISEPKPTSAVVPPPFGRCLLRRSSSLPPPRAPFPRRGGRGAVTVLVFGMGSPPTCWRADGGGPRRAEGGPRGRPRAGGRQTEEDVDGVSVPTVLCRRGSISAVWSVLQASETRGERPVGRTRNSGSKGRRQRSRTQTRWWGWGRVVAGASFALSPRVLPAASPPPPLDRCLPDSTNDEDDCGHVRPHRSAVEDNPGRGELHGPCGTGVGDRCRTCRDPEDSAGGGGASQGARAARQVRQALVGKKRVATKDPVRPRRRNPTDPYAAVAWPSRLASCVHAKCPSPEPSLGSRPASLTSPRHKACPSAAPRRQRSCALVRPN